MNLEEFIKLKRNIINWYPFKENSSILEIWEGKEDNEDASKYDYVAIIGLGQKKIEEVMDIACSKLKDNGKIIIAVDNKLGITDFCTEKKEKTNSISKKNLEQTLETFGFANRKFYYPMPNYKATNVIFTDKYLPNFETINRSLPLYDDNVEIALEEKKRYQTIIEEDKELFKNFANSFLVEATKTELEDNDICFVSYSNIRKPEYRIKTIIKGNEVHKTNNGTESEQHIENIKKNIDILNSCRINTIDSYNENNIISKYQNTEFLLDNVILNKLKQGQEQEALEIISNFQKELNEKLEKSEDGQNCFDKNNIEYKKENIENLHFVKNGLWDLIFQNCFYINNEFYFYDQEWYEENIPIEFIMYRAIKYFNKLSSYIAKDEMYEKLNISKEQIDIFNKLDDKLQEKIRDREIWEILIDKDARRKLIKLNELEQENIHLNAVVTQYSDRIKDFEKSMNEARENLVLQDNRIKEQDKIISDMTNSKSWEITKPLRKVSQIIKGSSNKKE